MEIKRIYSTKIKTLINRPILNNQYQYEFMRKMTNKEINQYLTELKQNIKKSNYIISKNIHNYNKMIKFLITEREQIYQRFKEIESENQNGLE